MCLKHDYWCKSFNISALPLKTMLCSPDTLLSLNINFPKRKINNSVIIHLIELWGFFFIKSYVKNLALSLLTYYSLDSQMSRIINPIVKDDRKFEAQSNPVELNIFSGDKGLGFGRGKVICLGKNNNYVVMEWKK